MKKKNIIRVQEESYGGGGRIYLICNSL